jgi:hypothetical protein
MSMKDDLKKEGYSKEDEYFYQRDRELLEKLRREAEARRQQQEQDNKKKEYWLRCPKCGSNLSEEKYDVVLVDRCTNGACGGVFFDGGELELLLKAKPSLLQRIFSK